MAFAKEFFDLQFSFAERVGQLSGGSLEAALLEYTNYYVRLGLGRDFDAGHAGWQCYLAGLRRAEDGRAWTYRYYLREPEAHTAPPVVATFGCFSYEVRAGDVVRLHFRNADAEGGSPLAAARADRRRAELAALLADASSRVGRDSRILGASWLYNLEAYRRLFPPVYLASARPIRHAFRSMPLWGQFLDRRGGVRPSMSRRFLDRLARASTPGDLEACFPFRALAVTAPAWQLHPFYGV